MDFLSSYVYINQYIGVSYSQKTIVQRVSILSSKCLDSCVPPLPPETACPGNAQDNESPALASQIGSSLCYIEFQGHLGKDIKLILIP